MSMGELSREGEKGHKGKENRPMAEALPSDECFLIDGRGDGMPSPGQILPYVLRLCRRVTDGGA